MTCGEMICFRYVWTEWATGLDLQWISKFLLFLPAAFETLATPGIASCLSRWSMKKVTWGGIEEIARLSFGSCTHSTHLVGLACCLMNVRAVELSIQSWFERYKFLPQEMSWDCGATVCKRSSYSSGFSKRRANWKLCEWAQVLWSPFCTINMSEHYPTFPIKLICFSFRSCAHLSAVVEDGGCRGLLPMARWGWAGGSLRGMEKKKRLAKLTLYLLS